jgi:hypothetical protein
MFINTKNKEYYRLRRESLYKKKSLILDCIKKAGSIANLSLKIAISVIELKRLLDNPLTITKYQLENLRKYYNYNGKKPFENIKSFDSYLDKKPVIRRKASTDDLPNDRSL